ncbi:SpoIID/LytB domain-containing protein [Clostridium sp. 19966]|uniref:SpoIID/LytB domain-containing protein n=1 Tax=Clostridium sp. 19966 TaxID=2768166 RepID=UPI0028DE4CE1|nr:SpoIID/LytB domain-containing protein [Clostridium sp. 19966]MDT8718409.1 SpoIID/LytB domain-containing protein [Clostridium sp. 19966]
MVKHYSKIFTVVLFITLIFPSLLVKKVYAYSNISYYSNVKVGLVSMSAANMSITLNGNYAINGQAYLSGTTLNLSISGNNILLNGTAQSQIALTPSSGENLIAITSGTATNKYMGAFLFKMYNNKILPINSIDMENYLKGVVGYEMSDSFTLEALKAQAVAARNYALSRIGYEAAKGYDFDDTPLYQVYKGFNSAYVNTINAVNQTAGQVLLYNDKLVEALYSAWHGGISENSENVWGNYVPYLRSVQDSYESDAWPNGNRILTNAQIQSTLIAKGYLASTDTLVKLDLTSITRFASGRVANINIIYKASTGTQYTKSVTKDSTRTFLALPSNLYTVTYDSAAGAYTFSGKGNGHGLGMSQIGAKNRAAAGQTFDTILKFYYQGTYLQSLTEKAALASFTENSSTILLGNKLSVNSTASGGSGQNYLFKYVIKNSGNVVYTRAFSTASNLDYIPTAAGSYTIDAYVKDQYSLLDYDDTKQLSAKVYSDQITNVTAASSFYEGKTVSFNTNATGFSNASGNYKYEVYYNGSLLTYNSFNASQSFSFTPNTAGTYSIKVYIKDALSTKAYDNVKAFDITINKKPLYISTLPLKYGMNNKDVASLQSALAQLGYSIKDASGNFGTSTKNAVISFQGSKSLTKDGIVGNMTYSALNEALIAKAGTKTITY